MSLLSAQLQSHTSQNHVTTANQNTQHHDHTPCPSELDGRTSVLNTILRKVCCTCCCSNAPWQRTGTLKKRMRERRNRDIYKVQHRYSSSMSDEDNYHQRYPSEQVGNYTQYNEEVDGISDRAVLDNVDGRHIPIVTEQQAAVHYNPERRTPSFSSHHSYAIHNVEPVRQSPMATSPKSARHDSMHHVNGGGFPVASDSFRNAHASTSSANGNHVSNNRQIHPQRQNHTSTFKKQSPVPYNIETDARIHSASQSVSYYPQTNGPEIYPQYTTFPSNYPGPSHRGNNNTLPGGDNVFVKSEPQRHLAMSARTVDLNRKDSSGRPPWMEVRRASIYDNSLPRNNDAYDFYQAPELPGGRNLNYYY